MASVVISGNTSGSVTLSAPAVAGSNTILLPAQTGDALVDIARSLTANGYVKLSNGLIIQWGTTASIAVNSSSVITFPIAFTTLLCAVGGKFGGIAAQDGGSGILSATNTTVTVYNGDNATAAAVSWIAIGI
jgi:hypothetical protein